MILTYLKNTFQPSSETTPSVLKRHARLTAATGLVLIACAGGLIVLGKDWHSIGNMGSVVPIFILIAAVIFGMGLHRLFWGHPQKALRT